MRASFPFHELECQRHQAFGPQPGRTRGAGPRAAARWGGGARTYKAPSRRRPPVQGARGASHRAPRSLGLLPRGPLAARAAAGAGLAAGAGPAGGAAAAAAAAERGGRAPCPLPLRLERREHLFGTHFVDLLFGFGTLAGNLCLGPVRLPVGGGGRGGGVGDSERSAGVELPAPTLSALLHGDIFPLATASVGRQRRSSPTASARARWSPSTPTPRGWLPRAPRATATAAGSTCGTAGCDSSTRPS